MERPRTPARLMAMLALAASLAGGCAQFRVPQIDPSGRRIFLPAPASTTLVTPFSGTAPAATTADGSFFPQPAWVAPPEPPPCGTPALAPGAIIAPPALTAPPIPICPPPATAPIPICPPALVSPPVPICPPALTAPPVPICPPAPVVPQVQVPAAPAPAAVVPATPVAVVGQEELILSPVRIVAPVGSQVVLLAGLRRPTGSYAPGQPIEWILSQESVGHFVEVGDEHGRHVAHWRHRAPRKLSNNYAVGRTSRSDQLITRGNANPADDVLVLRGQGWVSVASPTEGVSLVTALAPEAEGWDRRQQTAEIYWVNAQWTLPAPAHAPAGQPHTLTTVITRPNKLEPVPGWIVRYEVVGGSPAAFTPQGDQAVEVVTDATGAATAQLFPQGGSAGATQVRIQIIRPGLASHEPNRLLVGEGATTVSWSAPGLAVDVSGPATAALGTTLSYRIDVTNPGDTAAGNVTVRFHAPPGIAILNSTPAGSVFGDRIEWPLGQVAPGTVQTVVVNCRGSQAGDFNCCADARSEAANLVAEDCVLTRVVQQTMSLSMSGPERAVVGQQVQFQVVVRNEGGVPLTGVIVRDVFDAGFEHAQSASPIEKELNDIAPGQEAAFAVTFRVARAGTICHTMTATTSSGQTAQARSCLTATEPPPPQVNPAVAAQASGPAELAIGQTGQYLVDVVNSGEAPLTGVRVAVNPSASLQAVEATGGDNRQQVGGELVWTIDRLEPGAARRYQINCRAVQADPQASVRVVVTTREQAQDAANAVTRSTAGAQPPPPAQPAPSQRPAQEAEAPPPVAEGLELTVDDLNDPVRSGDSITYVLIVKNARTTPDRSVAITITLPENTRLVRINGPTQLQRTSQDGRTLVLAPVLEMRPGETLPPYRIEVTPQQPGRLLFRAEATSDRRPQKITVEEETTILAP
jgi:uncharacterized repeat protein (TIGR01451 family)